MLADPLAQRIAARFIRQAGYLNIGDIVLYGKYKNHHGKLVGFGQDKWGNPTIEVEPVPKGRKQNKTFGLYKVWRADVKEKALAEQARQEAAKKASSTETALAKLKGMQGGQDIPIPFGKQPVETELDPETDWNALPKTMALADLTPTQKTVSRSRVEGLMDLDPGPGLVVRQDGENLLLDGHHRITVDYLRGHESAEVNFADLDTSPDQSLVARIVSRCLADDDDHEYDE